MLAVAPCHPRRHHVVAVLLMAVLGCSSAVTPRPRIGGSASAVDRLTRLEIDSLMTQYANAYDLIYRARPNMLLSRDVRLPYPVREGLVSDPSGVKVFLDDAYIGGIDMLRRIPSRSIIFVQHLPPADATTRYGSGMVAGAIVLTSGTRWR